MADDEAPDPEPPTALLPPTFVPPLELRPTLVSRMALLPLFGVPAGLGALVASPLMIVGAAVGYAASWAAIRRRRLVVDDDGVEIVGHLGRRRLRWDEIDHYTYWSALMNAFWYQSRGQGGHLGSERLIDASAGSVATTRHHLTLSAGSRQVLLDSSFRGAHHAAARALTELHRRLRARGASEFDPFTLDDTGLAYRGHERLAWTEIEQVALTGETPPRVRILKRGKTLAWASVPLGAIRNGMLFLELLAEHGVPIDPGPVAMLTAPLLASMQRQRALPRAEVRRSKPRR